MPKADCPYCNQHVSYWVKLKPAFNFTQQFIICPHCRKKVSSFWIRGALGAGMSGVVAAHYIGKDSGWLAYVATVIGLFICSMMVMTFFIDLKEPDGESIKKIRSEMVANEMSYSWVRIFKIIGVTVGLFILLIWASQPSST